MMKKIIIILICLVFVNIIAQSDYDENMYKQFSQGMTESQKQILKKTLIEQKAMQEKLMKMSPEERERMTQEALVKMNSNKDQMKKQYEQMSPDEKAALQKMIQNANEMIKKSHLGE